MPGHRGRVIAAAGILSLGMALPAGAIEMFTYFGDGSRIGLPSLEVPIQAYPGIPLRSDRIRARMRSSQARRASAAESAARGGTAAPDGRVAIPGTGITVRPMTPPPGMSPAAPPAAPAPSAQPHVAPGRSPERVAPGEVPLPGLQQPVFPPRR